MGHLLLAVLATVQFGLIPRFDLWAVNMLFEGRKHKQHQKKCRQKNRDISNHKGYVYARPLRLRACRIAMPYPSPLAVW